MMLNIPEGNTTNIFMPNLLISLEGVPECADCKPNAGADEGPPRRTAHKSHRLF